MTPPTHFTCKLFCSGIGDQLSQLRTLYGLGRSFGLTYVHTPFVNRWSPSLDINEFLGLAIGERRISEFPGCTFLDTPFPVLLDRFNRRLLVADGPASLSRYTSTMYRFVATPEIYSQRPDFSAQPPDVHFDLAGKFTAAHRDKKGFNPFITNKIRVAVHIRRGDCTWFEENGSHVFPFLGKRVPAGVPDVDLRRALPVSSFATALDELKRQQGAEELEVRVYSEGHGAPIIGPLRGKLLLKHLCALVLKPIGLRRAWMPSVNVFNWRVQRRLASLRGELHQFSGDHPDIVLRAGRSAPLTREVICAFAYADIIVVARRHAFPDLGLGLNSRQVCVSPEDSGSLTFH